MSDAVLINGQAKEILFAIDKNHCVIQGKNSRLVLTGEQAKEASERNLVIENNREVLLNHFLVKKTNKVLSRKGENDAYLVFNLKWGVESYEQISLALGYKSSDEEFILKWIREYAMSFPDNSGWLDCVKFLWDSKFPEQIKHIHAEISYYSKKYEMSVHCCDGFTVEFREKLIDIFPFF